MGAPKRIGYIAAPRIWGNLWLGPGAHLAAPGGIIGAFNTMGDVYFVDIFNGNNAWDGTLPERDGATLHGPFQTIAYALTQCVNDHDDYIIVVDAWNEATPIDIDVSRVHIIGLASSPSRLYPTQMATGNTAIFTISGNCYYAEIAGFELGGGAAHAAIENVVGTAMGVYIHDCIFGSAHCGGNTPLDGILIQVNSTGMRIENCRFLGTGGNTPGTITRDGIRFIAAASPLGGDIVGNILQGCPGVAINMLNHGDGVVIERNRIACDADTQGAAITLAATIAGCFCVDNKAMYGDVAGGMIQNPFLDGAAAGNNHWAANMKGAAFTDPA